MPTKSELRRIMRARRRKLSATEQCRAAERLAAQLWACRAFRVSRRIAFYYPADGEIDPTPMLEQAWARKRRCYLPVLLPLLGNRLRFAEIAPGRSLVVNRYGIPEPEAGPGQWKSPWELDLLLMPLVAFDARGNRLGMGGGYYDRTLAYLRRRRHWRRPVLLGLAHDFQRVENLDRETWDVPLDGIITDRDSYRMSC